MKNYSGIFLIFLISSILISNSISSDFRVTVGISQITGQVGTGFDPNRIVPTAGDTITFSWLIPSYINNPQTGTYSVTQGSADSPCKPLSGGFDSGPKTTGPESAGQAPTMTFQVKDSNPLYFYSSVDNQCQKGMVLGVNTPASGQGSVESYITAAGGNPNADTTLGSSSNSTNTTNSITNTNTTTNNSSSSNTPNSKSISNNSKPLNSTGSAKPQNSSGSIIGFEILKTFSLLMMGYFMVSLF